MFSIIDILTISIIIILLVFLFILFQFEKLAAKSKIYLKSAIFVVILIAILEELIFLKQFFLIAWLYPFIILGYFLIYPLIYVYSRNLVYGSKERNSQQLITVLIFPLIILVLVTVIFYPMDYSSKVEFIKLHLWDSNSEMKEHLLFQYIITPAYYAQCVFYLIATIKLISVVRKNIHSKPWELVLVKYLLTYVIAVCLIEVLVSINSYFISDFALKITLEQTLSLLFLFLFLYIGIKQSVVIIQAKLTQYTDKFLNDSEASLPGNEEVITSNNELISEANSHRNIKMRLSENEKEQIKEAIENYFHDSRIFLDPNLKLETLAKKIHITSRRISIVINEVYGTNFNQFINEYRISEAIKLISQNNKKIVIENIFTKVGFNSRSAFNHAFKETTGSSPIEFLRKVNTTSVISQEAHSDSPDNRE